MTPPLSVRRPCSLCHGDRTDVGGAARWFSSPEPKALGTARLLSDSHIEVVDDLREHERGVTPWFGGRAEWEQVIGRVFAAPDEAALPGWEPLRRTTARLLPAVRRILDTHPREEDVVLVGHGTAWTALKAMLTGTAPDLDAWSQLKMPGVWALPSP